jgi:hypothetical protein
MKSFLLTGLSIAAISLAINLPVKAETKIAPSVKTTTNYVTPFELVGKAYQGEFKTHSVPGFGALIDSIKIGTITGKDLVRAGIEAKCLSAKMIDDRDYISSVDSQLKSLKF